MNIALTGYRGTGKSTIAKIIAERTGFVLRNLDAMIVEREGMPIPEIVEKYGWERFRDAETKVLEDVAKDDGQVLDCGGGIILRESNRKILKDAATVFLLWADVSAIVERIAGDDQRPSLTGKSFTEEVEEVLAEREPLYRQAADHVIDTAASTPEETADMIIHLLGI